MSYKCRGSEDCKQAGNTYHLAVVEEWEAQKGNSNYAPAPYAEEGFIHCTNGLDMMTTIANSFYSADDRERTLLVLDMAALGDTVRYDDADEVFPHVYGEIPVPAVLSEIPVSRTDDGRFIFG